MSCLFDSIASYTRNCTSHALRQMVADYLRENPVFWGEMRFKEVFDLFEPQDVHFCTSVEDYIDRMRQESTWGGALEIQCICNMFQIGVRVHTGLPLPIEFFPASSIRVSPRDGNHGNHGDHMDHVIHVLDISWNGYHFESVSTHSPTKHLPSHSRHRPPPLPLPRP